MKYTTLINLVERFMSYEDLEKLDEEGDNKAWNMKNVVKIWKKDLEEFPDEFWADMDYWAKTLVDWNRGKIKLSPDELEKMKMVQNTYYEMGVEDEFKKRVGKYKTKNESKTMLEIYSEENNEKLLYAIRRDDLETVKDLLSENDADVNYNKGEPLDMASSRGFLDIVKYLVSHPKMDLSYGLPALEHANANGHMDVVKYLQSLGIKSQFISKK